MLPTILHTIAKRPYVFIFLIAFLIISVRTRGVKRTLLFLFSGYAIAWASEALSIRTGFPYGWYAYVYENMPGEWMNWGVPVWDSLSYTFLCFAGLGLAEFFLLPRSPNTTSFKSYRQKTLKNFSMTEIFGLSLLSAVFIVILDVIVDPLANQGEKWFLGKIYYYPNPGNYFGVPFTNFAGWFLVGFLIVFVNLAIDKIFSRGRPSPMPVYPDRLLKLDHLLAPALYLSIVAFNAAITLWIRDFRLVVFDVTWLAFALLTGFLFRKKTTLS